MSHKPPLEKAGPWSYFKADLVYRKVSNCSEGETVSLLKGSPASTQRSVTGCKTEASAAWLSQNPRLGGGRGGEAGGSPSWGVHVYLEKW